ncbi:MAG: OmpA family protein, partial [Lutimonas sp.]
MMKNLQIIPFILLMLFYFIHPQNAEAQFFKKLKKHVEKKVESETEKRTNKKADEGVDEVFDTVEEGAENAVTGEEKDSDSLNQMSNNEENVEVNSKETEEIKTHEIKWAKYDFVPGDEVIFEDEPSADEENGEFPSRWDLHRGNVEIIEFDGENVIGFLDGSEIIPYLKNSKDDYLPDVFTVEFDAWFTEKYSGRYWMHFYDRKNQRNPSGTNYMVVHVNGLGLDKSNQTYPGKRQSNWDEVGGWRHISIAFTKGKMKAYLDDTRLINIPHYEGNPTGITIAAEKNGDTYKYIKNIRIAKGGVKYYDRFLSDGKIIVNGIRFDVNKATIKPESNGAINEIFELMKKHSDVKFSVEGHTDSDGDDQRNMLLSEERSKSVMDRL